MFNRYRRGVVWSLWFRFGAGAMFLLLAFSTLYPNDRLCGFAMATKTCRAAKLYQRPLKFNEKTICVKNRPLKVSILRDKRLLPKKSVDL